MSADLRHGIRVLRRDPGFAAAAVATLAIGVGASSLMFAVIEAVLLRPLPYASSRQLVAVLSDKSAKGVTGFALSWPKFEHVRAASRTLEELAAFYPTGVSVRLGEATEQVPAARATSSLFQLLGVRWAQGRGLRPIDDRPGAPPVAVLTNDYWRRAFPGRTLDGGTFLPIDGQAIAIVGVLPADFVFPFQQPIPDIWLSRVDEHADLGALRIRFGASYLNVLARLAPSQTLASADAELAALNATYTQGNAALVDGQWSVLTVQPARETLGGPLRDRLYTLFAATCCVLLIGCANLVGLVLAMALARIHEIAIRGALGATAARLFRQFAAEGVVVALAGSVAGIGLALAGIQLIRWLPGGLLPRQNEIGIDLPVVGFSLLLGAIVTTTFALAPLLLTRRARVDDMLKEGARTGRASRRSRRVRTVLVVAEVAVAVVLAVMTGLLTRSLDNLLRVPIGANPTGVTTFQLKLPPARYESPRQRAAFYARLLDGVNAQPSMQAAVTSHLPVTGSTRMVYFCPEAMVCRGVGKDPVIEVTPVSPQYFATMQTPLLQGRRFADGDTADAPKVAILSESTARHYFPNQNPIGRTVAYSRTVQQRILVAGVVGDVKINGLTGAGLDQMYVPVAQDPEASMFVVVRAALERHTVVDALRRQLRQIDPDVAFSKIAAMDEIVAEAVTLPKLTTALTTAFAMLALVLAAAGVYALLSYSVVQRTTEIGVRMALGADPAAIFGQVVRHALQLSLVGLAIGAAASLAAARVVKSLLFGTSAQDPVTFAAVAIVILVVTVVAGYLPARRAARMDPAVALRAN